MEFVPFPKMARLMREVIISEKIDGTNASIRIVPDYQCAVTDPVIYSAGGMAMLTGSRTRWITPDTDNAGFARWVVDHAAELMALGEGHHFGEWWGAGIQRRYGLDHKRFSLFNAARWSDDSVRPACCHVVPVLYRGTFSTDEVSGCLQHLADFGSLAAPGFRNPEGVVVYHIAGGIGFKATLGGDGHKGG